MTNVGENLKDPFGFWNENGKLTYHQGNVRIYNMDRQNYLFVDQVMYASTAERAWYALNVYPHAKGRCLEIGLGLGVASKAILSNKRVSHLLTIESNDYVIAAFGRPLLKHNILHANVYEWVNNLYNAEEMYDFIFVDHYTFDEEELNKLVQLSVDLKPLLKKDGRMVFWIDENGPEEDKHLIKQLEV